MRLKVDDIRPDEFNKLKELAIQADKTWIKSHKNNFVEGLCPVCKRRNGTIEYTVDEFVCYVRCTFCKTLYLDRHLTENDYAEYYRVSEVMQFFSKYIFPISVEQRKEHIYHHRMNHLLEVCKHNFPEKTINYCEIGAGSGHFAKLIKDSNFFDDVYVVEPSPSLAAHCRSLGLKTIESCVEDMANLPVDTCVAASFECLEHLVDPAHHIRSIYALLPHNGLFIISTPNSLGFDILELGSASSTLGFAHIHLFNPNSITKLFESIGFHILEISTPGLLDVDLVRRFLKEKGKHRDSWLHELLLHGDDTTLDDFQHFLVKHKMSSHMWLAAVKP